MLDPEARRKNFESFGRFNDPETLESDRDDGEEKLAAGLESQLAGLRRGPVYMKDRTFKGRLSAIDIVIWHAIGLDR